MQKVLPVEECHVKGHVNITSDDRGLEADKEEPKMFRVVE
jgi:hypothetical protein